jgi:hypothetical protein
MEKEKGPGSVKGFLDQVESWEGDVHDCISGVVLLAPAPGLGTLQGYPIASIVHSRNLCTYEQAITYLGSVKDCSSMVTQSI